MESRYGELARVQQAFATLEQRVRTAGYKGYDPYDALTGYIPFEKFGKWPPILAIQVGKRLPINLRPLMGIRKAQNPKALGLFLFGYSLLPPTEENRMRCRHLFDRLMELRSPGTSGVAWGYPFPWASPAKYLPPWSPTSVVSGFVAQGIDAYHRTYRDPRALEALLGVCEFISQDLHHTERNGDYAISYSTVAPDFCYNASLLAAQTYAMAHHHTGEAVFADRAARATTTVLSRQHPDGRWDYSESLETGHRRVQTDFHQGFVLDSLVSISENIHDLSDQMASALDRGFGFYRERQFTGEGRSMWRLPKAHPVDIHHQAQGVLTALRMYCRTRDEGALEMVWKTTRYALDNFALDNGGFGYRRHRLFSDSTEYMRWGNAWMFLAMAELIHRLGEEEHIVSFLRPPELQREPRTTP